MPQVAAQQAGRLGEALTDARLLKALKVAEAFAVKAVSAAECEGEMQSLVTAIDNFGGAFISPPVDRLAARAAVTLCDPATAPASPLAGVAKQASGAAVESSELDRPEQMFGLINRIQAYHVGVVSRVVGRAQH